MSRPQLCIGLLAVLFDSLEAMPKSTRAVPAAGATAFVSGDIDVGATG